MLVRPTGRRTLSWRRLRLASKGLARPAAVLVWDARQTDRLLR